jgi:hypothetical protein
VPRAFGGALYRGPRSLGVHGTHAEAGWRPAQVSRARTPMAPSPGGARHGQMGSAGGLGSGLVRAWVGLGGLRPAMQLRPGKEMKGHKQTLVAGPRRGDGLRLGQLGCGL